MAQKWNGSIEVKGKEALLNFANDAGTAMTVTMPTTQAYKLGESIVSACSSASKTAVGTAKGAAKGGTKKPAKGKGC